jgi:hypothetical protein
VTSQLTTVAERIVRGFKADAPWTCQVSPRLGSYKIGLFVEG